MYTLTQFKTKVGEILQDDAGKLTATEVADFIQEAIKQYSKHRPREIVRDITGTGAYDYVIATYLTAWIKGFSIIKSIEYPADQRDPEYIEEDDYKIYEKETGQILRFLNDTPLTTEKIRILYTALHILAEATVTITIASPAVITYAGHKLKPGDAVKFATTGALPTGLKAGTIYYVILEGLTANAFEVSATQGGSAINTSGTQSGAHTCQINTIPESDEDAIANLVASLCSEALASAYAHMTDSTITADSVDHKSKSQEFAARAKAKKKIYMDFLGIKEGEVPPVSHTKDWDVNFPWGEDRLTHPKKWR